MKLFGTFVYFCLLLLSAFSAVAEPVVILDKNKNKVNIAHYAEFTEAAQALPLIDVLADEYQFSWQKFVTNIPVLQHTEKAYWVRFKVKNSDQVALNNLLVIDFPLMESIELYQQVEQQAPQLYNSASISTPIFARDFPSGSYVFTLNLPANSERWFYLKLQNDSLIQLPICLYQVDAFYFDHNRAAFWLGGGLAILMLMSFTAFVLSVANKDTGFAYFGTFLFSFLIYYCSRTGYGIEFLWPSLIHYTKPIGMLSLGICLASLANFVQIFLRIKHTQIQLNTLFKLNTILVFCIAVSSLLLPHILQLYTQLLMYISTSGLIIYAMLKTPKKTKFGLKRFAFCMLIIILSAALFAANRFNILERSFITEYAILISQFLAFSILFNSVYDKVRREQLNTLRAKRKVQSLYQDLFDIYEHAVEGHYISKQNGQLVRANKAFCELLGCRSLSDLLVEVPNLARLYVLPGDRDKLVTKVNKQKRLTNFETQWRTQKGQVKWVSISLRIANKNGETLLIGSVLEISQRKRAEQKLQYMATHDSLTGLINRSAFEKSLRTLLTEAQALNSRHTLLYMDLDQFKLINDTCGHRAGDLLLVQIADRFKVELGSNDSIARFGGDEFCVLMENQFGEQAYQTANALKHAVDEFRFVWEGRSFSLGVSIGLIELNAENSNLSEVLSHADAACYTAKERGRNRIHQYIPADEDMQARQNEMLQVSEITEALTQDRFELYFQSIQSLQTKEDGLHYEILLRMRDATGRLLSPSQFLPAAERYSQMSRIDRWVIENYFCWLSEHPDHLEALAKGAINLSGLSLSDDEMQAFVLNCFDKYQIPYHKICFEVTETVAIMQLDKTLSFIHCFKDLGCSFSLDDFGSGFSSYVYLKNLPVDYLKIDGSFVKDMLVDPVDKAMVKSIYEVACAIGVKTIAEFVESKEIKEELFTIGVNYAQGYGISKPSPLTDISLASG
ncbi:EAL domain-containing protein [Gayadomonas joobiniege]|uniref:EAL domain-containing protein n=1 Tax=Gayadomonas joobiniege TaxID=1234606 RepID=UPI000370AD83|nr:EAL domain-containing protein [Gayadomonas joobiniege]